MVRIDHRHGISALQWVLIAAVAALVIMGIFMFSYYATGGGRLYGMMSYPFFPLGFGFMGIFWILVIVAIPLLIIWPGNRGQVNAAVQPDDALQVLRMRYAKGEITKEQFDQMSRDLTQKS